MAQPQLNSQPRLAEAELVRRAVGKDESAIRAIIQANNRRLYRVARSIVRDDSEAEDVVQEAYLRAFSALPEFRGESSLATGSRVSCSTKRYRDGAGASNSPSSPLVRKRAHHRSYPSHSPEIKPWTQRARLPNAKFSG